MLPDASLNHSPTVRYRSPVTSAPFGSHGLSREIAQILEHFCGDVELSTAQR